MKRALTRFLLLGFLLFVADRALRRDGLGSPQGGGEDEVLYREALALGLDRGDSVVQRRLLQNMAFLESEGSTATERRAEAVDLGMASSDLVVRRRLVERLRAHLSGVDEDVSDAELQSYLDRHADEFASPPLLRLSQQYLGSEPLPLPASLPPKSPAALEKLFGREFVAAVRALPLGEWHGPLRSVYGLHRVRVEEVTPRQPAQLREVRARVRGTLLAERAAERVERALRELRERNAG